MLVMPDHLDGQNECRQGEANRIRHNDWRLATKDTEARPQRETGHCQSVHPPRNRRGVSRAYDLCGLRHKANDRTRGCAIANDRRCVHSVLPKAAPVPFRGFKGICARLKQGRWHFSTRVPRFTGDRMSP